MVCSQLDEIVFGSNRVVTVATQLRKKGGHLPCDIANIVLANNDIKMDTNTVSTTVYS